MYYSDDDDPKTVQLLPAVGWRVLYANDDGTGTYSDLVFVGIYGPSDQHTEGETALLVANWKKRQKKSA